jgi:autotransporter strand-loop-strand O-heptosyltransferase
MKNPAFYTASLAIGDCISATPTIRKLSEVYNRKVVVFSHHPDIFSRLPYVERSEDVKEYITLDKSEKLRQEFDVHYSFWKMGQKVSLSDDRGIEMKHAMIDIRQYHAIDNGFTLLPEEMHCDFIPDKSQEVPDLPEKFVCLHPFQNWSSRTWDSDSWKNLLGELKKLNIPVVIIGKDSLDENLVSYLKEGVRGKTDDRVFQEMGKREILEVSDSDIIDLTNRTSLSQAFEIISRSFAVVTMDSGILHLAGTTDTNIIQLGSSINPFFRSPYRKGRQDYKYYYVHGSCKIFCASSMKYSLRDWEFGCNGGTPLQCVPLIDTCLENKPTFECHPSHTQVLDIINEIWMKEKHSEKPKTPNEIEQEDPLILVKIESKSLGDQIGAMSVISKFSENKKVYVICSLDKNTFTKSYPNLNFLSYETNPILNTRSGKWELPDLKLIFSEFRILQYKFDKPLITGYAEQLGVENWERPKIDLFKGDRPIKSKYACFSMHSTAQSKHWNYPGGWEKLCRMLRKSGITPVCIDVHGSFGIEGHWNKVPGPALKKQGMDLKEMSNFIHHSEFFIGISSGLSWVAHALGKKVVMISGVTSEDNEFEEDTIRIINKNVCHGCINKPEITFDPGDWLWCPLHKGTDRQFECSKTITPEEVFDVIERNLL